MNMKMMVGVALGLVLASQAFAQRVVTTPTADHGSTQTDKDPRKAAVLPPAEASAASKGSMKTALIVGGVAVGVIAIAAGGGGSSKSSTTGTTGT